MPKSWSEALKEFNKGKKWSVPRKGTEEYNAVRKIMSDGASAPAAAPKEKKPRAPRKKKEAAAPAPAAPEKKPRGRPRKEANKPVLKDEGIRHKNDPMKTTPKLDTPHIEEAKKVIDPARAPKPAEPKKKKVGRSGKPGNAEIAEHQTDDRVGLGTKVAPADYPDLKKQVEKVLEMKSNPLDVHNKSEKDETTENLKTNDAVALETLAPFSFASLRRRLRA